MPDLASKSLIYIGQLCDAGCKVTFDASGIIVYYADKIALTGKRTSFTRSWHLDIPMSANNLSHCGPNYVKYECNAAVGSATALFSPALSTLEHDFYKGYFTNFPGLSKTILTKASTAIDTHGSIGSC